MHTAVQSVSSLHAQPPALSVQGTACGGHNQESVSPATHHDRVTGLQPRTPTAGILRTCSCRTDVRIAFGLHTRGREPWGRGPRPTPTPAPGTGRISSPFRVLNLPSPLSYRKQHPHRRAPCVVFLLGSVGSQASVRASRKRERFPWGLGGDGVS